MSEKNPKRAAAVMMAGGLALGLLSVAGCGSSYQVPVSDLDETPRFLDAGRMHRVNEGETLYVIAWIYDLDFMHLAQVNNLSAPYILQPGQLLNVDPRAQSGSAAAAANNASASVRSAARQAAGEAGRSASAPSRDVNRGASEAGASAPAAEGASQSAGAAGRNAGSASGNVRDVDQDLRTAGPEPTDSSQGDIAAGRNSETSGQATPASAIAWGWPAAGSVIGRFSEAGVANRGINIAGEEGDQVVAAASGEVVYAGSALLRYGDMIIIKHDDRFLSAYAHNSALSVAEGDRVSRGQKIAELGSTGIDRDMLHFEIRLEGKPVDPMIYLPPRS